MTDLRAENRALQRQLRVLTEEARRNESVLQRVLHRELALLSIESMGELLLALTDGLRSSFGLKAATLSLLDPDHRIRHLLRQAGQAPETFPQVRFVEREEDFDPLIAGLRHPRLGSFQARVHAGLFPAVTGLSSVALLPLLRGRLLGSINLASDDPDRYTHRHASDFLHRLGVIGALCLENAVNREQLVINGYTDPLTGLKNRRYLESRLPEELAAAQRYRQVLSCLFVDADHFKVINDRHGHAIGDRVLRELAACLQAELRASDVAVRYGGEEFALLLPRTGAESALLLAERIRGAVAALALSDATGNRLRVSVSVGVAAHCPGTGDGSVEARAERLLRDADQALYRAKAAGRNRVLLWDGQSRLPLVQGTETRDVSPPGDVRG